MSHIAICTCGEKYRNDGKHLPGCPAYRRGNPSPKKVLVREWWEVVGTSHLGVPVQVAMKGLRYVWSDGPAEKVTTLVNAKIARDEAESHFSGVEDVKILHVRRFKVTK